MLKNKTYRHIHLEKCQKCNGQVGYEEDSFGIRKVCIQCGWNRNLSNTEEIKFRELTKK